MNAHRAAHQDIHQRLKGSLAKTHRQLHQSAVAGAIIAGRLTLDEYLWLLKQHLELHDWLDENRPASDRLVNVFPSDVSRSRLICRDFAKWRTRHVDLEAHPALVRLISELTASVREDPAVWLGVAYVMEGSRNGNSLVRDLLARSLRLPLGPDAGIDYFSDDQSCVGARWRTILERLRQTILSDADQDAVLFGASSVMTGLLQVYNSPPRTRRVTAYSP